MKILSNVTKKLTSFYNSVSGNLKKIALILFSRKKVIIDYNFNMKDYFTLDGKIEENRRYLRELYEKYRKIENYYPLFFGYLAFIGIYYFDFIIYLFKDNNFTYSKLWFFIELLPSFIGIVYSIYLMVNVLYLKEWYDDNDPSGIYKGTMNNAKLVYPELTTRELERITKESYLETLELNVKDNNKTYDKKKKKVSVLIKVIVITLIVYSVNITHYKFLNVMGTERTNETPQTTKVETARIIRTEGDSSKEGKEVLTDSLSIKKKK